MTAVYSWQAVLAQDQGRPCSRTCSAAIPRRRPRRRRWPTTPICRCSINQLQAQVRQLTGTIEQLQYRNQQLEQQVRACRAMRRKPGCRTAAASRRDRRAPAIQPLPATRPVSSSRAACPQASPITPDDPPPGRCGCAGSPLRRVRPVAKSKCARRAAGARLRADPSQPPSAHLMAVAPARRLTSRHHGRRRTRSRRTRAGHAAAAAAAIPALPARGNGQRRCRRRNAARRIRSRFRLCAAQRLRAGRRQRCAVS